MMLTDLAVSGSAYAAQNCASEIEQAMTTLHLSTLQGSTAALSITSVDTFMPDEGAKNMLLSSDTSVVESNSRNVTPVASTGTISNNPLLQLHPRVPSQLQMKAAKITM
jgi:hypothetical protein